MRWTVVDLAQCPLAGFDVRNIGLLVYVTIMMTGMFGFSLLRHYFIQTQCFDVSSSSL
jgi:hypothetical protein